MEKKKVVKQSNLLPAYFKGIGLAIFLVTLVTALAFKGLNINIDPAQKGVWIVNLMILGLALVAWSKDKVEDEMTGMIRLKSMAGIFSFAVFSAMIPSFSFLIFREHVEEPSVQAFVAALLVIYLVIFNLYKIVR